jgi:hypothetical protein
MITNQKIKAIQDFLNEKIKEIEAKEKVKINFEQIKYTPGNYKCQMVVNE